MNLRDRPGLRALCGLLGMIIVVFALTSCRRQTSHVESVETDEEANQDPVSEPGSDILFEDWIYQGRSVHALSGQLLLTLSAAGFDSQKMGYTASLRMKFSDQEEEVWNDLAVGGRKTVEFESAEYMIDVLEIVQGRARIAIVRKR